MIPAQFEYHRPATVKEALRLLGTLPDAKLLAGGHSLLPLMKLRLVSPPHVIDLGRIAELRAIKAEKNGLAIGALVTHWMIESSDIIKARAPLLAQTAARIGDVQVRNLGTIGGSVAHADPASDYPAALLALEAELVAEGPSGRRTIPVGEFFTGLFSTALRSDEILLDVRIPDRPVRTGSAYLKFAHPASGFAVVGVAASVTLDADGRCARAAIGITGVAPVAYRAAATEQMLAGRSLDVAAVEAAAAKAADGVDVNEDIFASADYRGHLARVFTRRAITQALSEVSG